MKFIHGQTSKNDKTKSKIIEIVRFVLLNKLFGEKSHQSQKVEFIFEFHIYLKRFVAFFSVSSRDPISSFFPFFLSFFINFFDKSIDLSKFSTEER